MQTRSATTRQLQLQDSPFYYKDSKERVIPDCDNMWDEDWTKVMWKGILLYDLMERMEKYLVNEGVLSRFNCSNMDEYGWLMVACEIGFDTERCDWEIFICMDDTGSDEEGMEGDAGFIGFACQLFHNACGTIEGCANVRVMRSNTIERTDFEYNKSCTIWFDDTMIRY
jgi:hypothetical protein